MDWEFYKRVLSAYPLAYTRVFFPTAGRSDGVIKGLRMKAQTLINSMFPAETDQKSTASFTDPVSPVEIKQVRISNWSPSLMLRRLASMRIGCQGRHGFNGLKQLAFHRMLHQAQTQGHVIVVVLPVSSSYAREFLAPEVKGDFESALAEARQAAPKSHWVRLDQLNGLNSDDNFYDLVHMNTQGKALATEALLSRLRELNIQS